MPLLNQKTPPLSVYLRPESNIAKFQQHAQEKDAEISGLQRELQTLRVELHADVI